MPGAEKKRRTMKKKFDIIKYIKTCIKNYDEGSCSKTNLIKDINHAISKDSWQMQCDGKEVTNDSIKGFDFNGNLQTYYVINEWCVEEE